MPSVEASGSRPYFCDCKFLQTSVVYLNKLVGSVAENVVNNQIARDESVSRLGATVLLEGLAGYGGMLTTASLLGYSWWSADTGYASYAAWSLAVSVTGFAAKYFVVDRPTSFDNMMNVWKEVVSALTNNDGAKLLESLKDIFRAYRLQNDNLKQTVAGMNGKSFNASLHHLNGLAYMLLAANLAEQEVIDLDKIEELVDLTVKHMVLGNVKKDDESLMLYKKYFLELVKAGAAAKAQEIADREAQAALQLLAAVENAEEVVQAKAVPQALPAA